MAWTKAAFATSFPLRTMPILNFVQGLCCMEPFMCVLHCKTCSSSIIVCMELYTKEKKKKVFFELGLLSLELEKSDFSATYWIFKENIGGTKIKLVEHLLS